MSSPLTSNDKGMYQFRLRPCYNSDELLIEFTKGTENSTFFEDLFKAIRILQPENAETIDVWMNDEIWWIITTSEGNLMLTMDNYDFAFIMSPNFQDLIQKVAQLLELDARFTREEVDFKTFKVH